MHWYICIIYSSYIFNLNISASCITNTDARTILGVTAINIGYIDIQNIAEHNIPTKSPEIKYITLSEDGAHDGHILSICVPVK